MTRFVSVTLKVTGGLLSVTGVTGEVVLVRGQGEGSIIEGGWEIVRLLMMWMRIYFVPAEGKAFAITQAVRF